MKKTILFALLALISLGTIAAPKTKKKSKKEQAPVEVVDTVSMSDFSYAFGKANTMGLQQYLAQRMGVEAAYMADFVAGFDAGEMTEADKKMKARLAGMEIRSQVMEQIIPQASSQINDTIDLLNHEQFVKGFRNGILGNEEDGLTMDSAQTVVRKQIEYYHAQLMEAKYGAVRDAGVKFLKENAKNKDVVTTASGLQYKVLVKGEGEIPTATQKVKVNYEGHLLDGTEFDSSYKRNQPATFACNQVIKGWTEALTMMPVGSKWELYIPQELAYGDRESGKIPPYSMLIFTVELLEVVK